MIVGETVTCHPKRHVIPVIFVWHSDGTEVNCNTSWPKSKRMCFSERIRHSVPDFKQQEHSPRVKKWAPADGDNARLKTRQREDN